jgi:hypothetical protein
MMETISGCRSCASADLHVILELGSTPLANALLKPDELDRPEPRFPLTLLFCGACGLVQIRETVEPEVLFGHYLYFSSFSTTLLEHARDEVEMLCRRFEPRENSLVVEIASNDGYLLKNFVSRGIPALGIEPAANIAEAAIAAGVPTRCEFFGLELSRSLAAEGKRADLILANNVLAHATDTRGFAEGLAALLEENGRAVLEFPYLADMIDGSEFDTIYHEHLCYFSLHAVRNLFGRYGLILFDVERHPIHGGSLRIFLQPESSAPAASAAVERLLDEEERRGLTAKAYYQEFGRRVERILQDLRSELAGRKAAGQSLAAYGASAKGSTLLNTLGLEPGTLDFVADRSTVKQGFHTPGLHLPIVPPDALVQRRPDAALLLTWNFADEIFRQQSEYLLSGGKFIIPVPRLSVVGKEVLAC